MRKESVADRAAWTQYIDGTKPPKANKYKNIRTNGYASNREAKVAANLKLLESDGQIKELREQVRLTILPRKGQLRAITYIADFQYLDMEGKLHTLDAKGFKTDIYRLKKTLVAHLLNIEIEEV